MRLRPWVLHWGATEQEVTGALPSDEIVADPGWQSTRAIDIAAPVEAVWPWLAQMGQDRGGLYSLDWLESLAGFELHSADRIVPEWQEVHLGDFVRFAPDQDTLVVAQVKPTRHLVWRILKPGTHQTGDLSEESISADATWAFVLRAIDERHTRLIQRFRWHHDHHASIKHGWHIHVHGDGGSCNAIAESNENSNTVTMSFSTL